MQQLRGNHFHLQKGMSNFEEKEHEGEPRECPGFYCVKLENNSPEETLESPGDLLTHMEF